MRGKISIYKSSFYGMVSQITQDYMFFAAVFAPILAGIVIHFGVPFIEKLLTCHFKQEEVLAPYFPMFDLLLIILTPLMFGFISALLMLDEKDDRIISYLSVTPLGKNGYIGSRLLIPATLSIIIAFLVTMVFHISSLSYGKLLIYSIYSGFLGIIICLFIVCLSTNKVEGMAIGKLSGLMLLGIFIPFLIPTNIQYVAAILPSYYLGKYTVTGNGAWLLPGAVISALWCMALYRRFIKRTFY